MKKIEKLPGLINLSIFPVMPLIGSHGQVDMDGEEICFCGFRTFVDSTGT
jgi:hypothetical protein